MQRETDWPSTLILTPTQAASLSRLLATLDGQVCIRQKNAWTRVLVRAQTEEGFRDAIVDANGGIVSPRPANGAVTARPMPR